ncbi:AcrR family transcriptional regulator [Nocardioides luteus]|uniref:Transcriptional regulator n=1 Tax=Nocardioides luteus TaxID=1844 RepID=A0ABQ5T1V6_9ACTN|nr:TetR/AcrR family transcriptional regulator [Nocardioides luteus]MDR7311590.1 AcrR family transcriptional regulator [Nocardioides luteus]GGR54566.1 transcriptional regulator [Nocardioides luteus]GLJ70239.1 transcriptional regulator [Nocardioides luteus]
MPRAVDHEQRRFEIVAGLWQIVAEQGIEGISLRSVAARSEVSMGRVQHYFGTKDALVVAGIDLLVKRAVIEYETTAGRPPDERLLHLLLQQIPATEAGRMGVTVWYAYVAKAMTHTAVREILAEATRVGVEECTRHIQEADGLPKAAARERAIELLALSDGLTLRVLVGDITAAEAEASIRDHRARL